jgi:hypothetical protein
VGGFNLAICPADFQGIVFNFETLNHQRFWIVWQEIDFYLGVIGHAVRAAGIVPQPDVMESVGYARRPTDSQYSLFSID